MVGCWGWSRYVEGYEGCLGFLVFWFLGFLVSWFLSFLVSLFHVSLVPWLFCFLVSCFLGLFVSKFLEVKVSKIHNLHLMVFERDWFLITKFHVMFSGRH